MNTQSVTTSLVTAPPGRVERRQITDLEVRNWLLDALTVSSGAVDSISFLTLGKIFTAFITGNVAFLGMALAGYPGAPRVVAVLASMAGFAIGIYLATKIVKTPAAISSEKAKAEIWPRRTTIALGLSLVAHLGFVVTWFATKSHPDDNVVPILLAVWALAMGMQSAAVRNLNVAGIFTTAATATFIFLFGAWANRRLTGDERRRMRGIPISLVIGATGGALLLTHAPIYAPALPLLITLGVVATAASVFRCHKETQRPRKQTY